MSARDKVLTLLDRLVNLTTAGRIEWRSAGDDAPYSYEYVSGTGQRVVIDSRDDDGAVPYDLVVYGPHGDIITTLDYDSASSRLINLWELARDAVSGTSTKLDELLAGLPAEDDIPF